MLYSSQAFKHLLLTIASAVIPERHIKTTFPESCFTKLLCRQDNSYGNGAQSFVFTSPSPPAIGWAQHHPACQPLWAQKHTETDCYSTCWLDSNSVLQPLTSLQGRFWLWTRRPRCLFIMIEYSAILSKVMTSTPPTWNPQTQTQIQLENTEPRITDLTGAG